MDTKGPCVRRVLSLGSVSSAEEWFDNGCFPVAGSFMSAPERNVKLLVFYYCIGISRPIYDRFLVLPQVKISIFILFLKDFIYSFLDRGERREKERERNINV